jgi:hypothetical protein
LKVDSWVLVMMEDPRTLSSTYLGCGALGVLIDQPVEEEGEEHVLALEAQGRSVLP